MSKQKELPVHWTNKELPTYEMGTEPTLNSHLIIPVQDGIQKFSIQSLVRPSVAEKLMGLFNGKSEEEK